MIYFLPTKHGMGVELWGTYDDLTNFYDFISKFWNNDDKLNIKGYENRDKLISGFSYEIRKAHEGVRLKRQTSHFSQEEYIYYGTKISWVHFLFTLSALKYNMLYAETSKYDISTLLLLEFWIENAMNKFDEVGAKNLTEFIEDGLYAANEYIYHYMRIINLDYYMLGGGKKAFRKLPDLLKKGVCFTEEYNSFRSFLEKEAKRLGCDVNDIDIDDDHFDYDKILW